MQAPRGAYIWRDDLTEDFLRYRFGGLKFGGAYFRNFTVCDGLAIHKAKPVTLSLVIYQLN